MACSGETIHTIIICVFLICVSTKGLFVAKLILVSNNNFLLKGDSIITDFRFDGVLGLILKLNFKFFKIISGNMLFTRESSISKKLNHFFPLIRDINVDQRNDKKRFFFL